MYFILTTCVGSKVRFGSFTRVHFSYSFLTFFVAGWFCLNPLGSENHKEEEEKVEEIHLALIICCLGWNDSEGSRAGFIYHLSAVMTPCDVLALRTFTAAMIDLQQCAVCVPQTFIDVINLSIFPYFIVLHGLLSHSTFYKSLQPGQQ